VNKTDAGFRPFLIRAAVATAIGAAFAMGSAPTFAAEDTLEEVQVTGSRILRRDYDSNSPLVSVESEAFESRTGLNIESYLNQLPQFNPATTPTTAQFDVQITPVNSVGISSISLRGFGPNRNLVLVDGHRSVPINALMVTDINYIPSALIERVEIISGGASAVYGADAIGGVTNFITRQNFEGFEADMQYGIAEAGDSQETRVYALMGANFADGRGNVTFEAESYDREAAFRRNRSFFTDSYNDPTVGSPDFFVFGYNGYNSALSFNVPSANAVDALFPNRPIYPATNPDTGLPNPGANLRTGFRNVGGNGVFEGFRFNNNGTIFNPGLGNNLNKFTGNGGVIDGVEYAYQNAYDATLPGISGQIMQIAKWYNPDAYTSSPQTRHSAYASGTFDFTDHITAFARSTFATSTTKTRLFPANASFGWEASIPYNPTTDSPLLPTLDYNNIALVRAAVANPNDPLYRNPNFRPTGQTGALAAQHPVSVEAAVLLNSRTNLFTGAPAQTASWVLETFPKESFDDRATTNTNQVWQVEGGLRFDLPIKDWNGEAYFAHGESDTYNQATGNNSLTRWRALVATNDYGRNAKISGNQTGASVGFGAADITCGSGFYNTIFAGDQRPSQDCINAVAANLQTNTHNKQEVAELNFQGGLFDLPAGEVRGAAGYQWRKNWSKFTPDILQSTSSFTDQVIGVYPTGYLDASTFVRDYYAELLIPVVSDLKFLKKFELELGGRYSDYEHTDETFTYKITGNIEINDYVRFRGGYNKATRAPNLGELFLNVQEFFGTGGNFGDPCSGRSNAPYGAGGVAPDPQPNNPPGEGPTQLASGQTVQGATSAYLICQAQMTPTALAAYYGPTGNAVAQGAGGGFAWLLQQGNPDLESEEADTYTAGVVLTSHFQNPWLSGLSATLDWYSVDIQNAIQQYSTDYAANLCYGAVLVTTAAEAAAQAATRQCQNTARNAATGGPTNALIEYSNQATIKTAGYDVGLNWIVGFSDVGLDKVPGRFAVNVQASFLDYYKTKTSPAVFDVETDWKGTFGPTLAGTNGGSYDYRIFSSFSYILEDVSVSLRWRHLPGISSAQQASQDAIIKNNERVAAGEPGIKLSYTPITNVKVSSYDIMDLSGSWAINKTLTLRAGIDNLFDVDPAITGKTKGRPYDPTLSAAANLVERNKACDAAAQALGCQNPGGYSLASSGAGTTNAGYYDTIGRRYFVGLKARF
jgi:iron complex outermembrane recepter protein